MYEYHCVMSLEDLTPW